MKIAYFGHAFFLNCLDFLIRDGHEIVALYSQNCDNFYNFNQSSLKIAERIGCPVYFHKPDQQQIDALAAQGCELLVAALYEHKIPLPTQGSNLRGINIHPASLPDARGPWVPPLTILQGATQSAATIHKLDEKFDCGDILHRETVNLSKQENLETLSCKLQMAALLSLKTVMNDFERYWNEATSQKDGIYYPYPDDSLRTLQFTDPVEKIDRTARAFGKLESFVIFDGKKWLVQDASVWQDKHNFNPGQVVHRSSKEVVIAALDGFVCLRHFEMHPQWRQHRFDEYQNIPPV